MATGVILFIVLLIAGGVAGGLLAFLLLRLLDGNHIEITEDDGDDEK